MVSEEIKQYKDQEKYSSQIYEGIMRKYCVLTISAQSCELNKNIYFFKWCDSHQQSLPAPGEVTEQEEHYIHSDRLPNRIIAGEIVIGIGRILQGNEF